VKSEIPMPTQALATQALDRETEQYLTEILAQENTTTDELIKTLIRDRWLSLQEQALVSPDSFQKQPSFELPKQRNQKQAIVEFLKRKRCQQ
jgi:hypothetical protein